LEVPTNYLTVAIYYRDWIVTSWNGYSATVTKARFKLFI